MQRLLDDIYHPKKRYKANNKRGPGREISSGCSSLVVERTEAMPRVAPANDDQKLVQQQIHNDDDDPFVHNDGDDNNYEEEKELSADDQYRRSVLLASAVKCHAFGWHIIPAEDKSNEDSLSKKDYWHCSADVCNCPRFKRLHECVHTAIIQSHNCGCQSPDNLALAPLQQPSVVSVACHEEYYVMEVFSVILTSTSRPVIVWIRRAVAPKQGITLACRHCSDTKYIHRSEVMEFISGTRGEEALTVFSNCVLSALPPIAESKTLSSKPIPVPLWAAIEAYGDVVEDVYDAAIMRATNNLSENHLIQQFKCNNCGASFHVAVSSRDEDGCVIEAVKLYMETYAVNAFVVESRACDACHTVSKFDGLHEQIFYYSRQILVTHRLLNQYTKHYSTTETTFHSYHDLVSASYLEYGSTLKPLSEPTFAKVWHSFVRLQRWLYPFECRDCGKYPDVVICDGVSVHSPLAYCHSLKPLTDSDASNFIKVKPNKKSLFIESASVRKDVLTWLLNLKSTLASNNEINIRDFLFDKKDDAEMEGAVQTCGELPQADDEDWKEANVNDCDAVDEEMVLEQESQSGAQDSRVNADTGAGAVDSPWEKIAKVVEEDHRVFSLLKDIKVSILNGISRHITSLMMRLMRILSADSSLLAFLPSNLSALLLEFLDDTTTPIRRFGIKKEISNKSAFLVEFFNVFDDAMLELYPGVRMCLIGAATATSLLSANHPGPSFLALELNYDHRATFQSEGSFYGMPCIRRRPKYSCDKQDAKNRNDSYSCRKEFGKSKNMTGGLMILWCRHRVCLGFHVMKSAEGQTMCFLRF